MTSSVAPVDMAREAYYDRLVNDTELTDLLGHTDSDERIVWARKRDVFGRDDEVAADDFPLLTYFGQDAGQPTKGVGAVRVQNDIWTWPDGGGLDLIKEIDAALLGRVYEEAWSFDGRRFYCRQTSFRNWLPNEGEPLRRTREFIVHVSGAS